MLFALPIALERRDQPCRPTPLAWTLVALGAILFALDRIALLDIARGWRLPPRAAWAWTLRLIDDAALYPRGSGLFGVWQPWTWALLHDGWWAAIADLVVLAVCARAIERAWGAAWLAAVAIVVPPCAALALLVSERAFEPAAGGGALVAAMLGFACGALADARVRWAFGYWLVVVVGAITVSVAPPWLAFAWLAQEAARQALESGAVRYEPVLAALATGLGLAGVALVARRAERAPS